jgi:copper(I)-binding protein
MTKNFSRLTLATLLTIPAIVQAAPTRHVTIEQPWARETAEGQAAGGGFMTIVNTARQSDQLLSASAPVAREVQIHTMSMDGGVMRMRHLPEGVTVPAKGRLDLKPGGLHIMFIGLKEPLRRGTHVPVTLNFKNAGTMTVDFSVQPITAALPMGHGQ